MSYKASYLVGKYVTKTPGEEGAVMVSVKRHRDCATELILVRTHDNDGNHDNLAAVHHCILDSRWNPYRIQGQVVSRHGEQTRGQDKRLVDMVLIDGDLDNYRKVHAKVEVKEYR